MDTDALIEALAADVRKVPRGAVERRLATGIVAGVSAALLLLLALLGLRSDLEAAAITPFFWGKAAFTFALGCAGLVLCAQLARPDIRWPRGSWLIALPLLALTLAAAGELAAVGRHDAAELLASPRWSCVPAILMLTAPLSVGLIWAFRTLAPTRMRFAGAAIGLASASFGATIYGLCCEQSSPTFVLTRYTAAIAVAAAIGAIGGPRLLRW